MMLMYAKLEAIFARPILKLPSYAESACKGSSTPFARRVNVKNEGFCVW
eukprot:CAMPEP_0180415990 /NCGR_PEP_ID=MMETSP1036_2-20121128/227_1 /TAXON_ID=632150 /ORGANISM="Azadinium spinosum, Strain 3D9" /LENGTH=48 /DNA_ID= /DNA_START= /DNA_END= /DNA_ORIENTATION=